LASRDLVVDRVGGLLPTEVPDRDLEVGTPLVRGDRRKYPFGLAKVQWALSRSLQEAALDEVGGPRPPREAKVSGRV